MSAWRGTHQSRPRRECLVDDHWFSDRPRRRSCHRRPRASDIRSPNASTPRPRRNAGIADPEGFAISWSALVRGGHSFRSDTSSDILALPNLNDRRFPRLFRGILTATSAEVSVVPKGRLWRVPKPLRGNLDDASLLIPALFEAVHQ